jgi:hypothetical protein
MTVISLNIRGIKQRFYLCGSRDTATAVVAPRIMETCNERTPLRDRLPWSCAQMYFRRLAVQRGHVCSALEDKLAIVVVHRVQCR